MLLVRRILELLYNQGFTISGARSRLDDVVPEVAFSEIAPEVLRKELLSIADFLRI